MGFFDDIFGWGGEDPEAIRQRQEAQRRINAKAAADAEAARVEKERQDREAELARLAEEDRQRQAAEAARKALATTQARQAAAAGVEGVLPSGFENTYVGAGDINPLVASTAGQGRAKADEFIGNLFRRGTITESGKASGTASLESQTPGVTKRLTDIGNVLLERERGKLRDIRGGALTAAGQVEPGQAFDPNTYGSQASSEASAFRAGLPTSFASGLPTGDLYDVSNLGAVSGAPSGGQTTPGFDPYAVSGGLKTGTEDQPTPKKRTTAVF